MDDHVGPGLAQFEGDGPADPRRRAEHDGPEPGEFATRIQRPAFLMAGGIRASRSGFRHSEASLS